MANAKRIRGDDIPNVFSIDGDRFEVAWQLAGGNEDEAQRLMDAQTKDVVIVKCAFSTTMSP